MQNNREDVPVIIRIDIQKLPISFLCLLNSVQLQIKWCSMFLNSSFVNLKTHNTWLHLHPQNTLSMQHNFPVCPAQIEPLYRYLLALKLRILAYQLTLRSSIMIISIRLQRRFHNKTLKVNCCVSYGQTKPNMTRMSAVITLQVTLTKYQTVTLVMDGSE